MSADIWCSQQDANGNWQDPVNQGPNINTPASEFHFMEDEEGVVYFSSGRPGGYGSMDSWASKHLSSDAGGAHTWGPAVNLGSAVNTPATDICPALPPDGETFTWFSYREDNTLGPADIFWTYKENHKVAR